MLLRYSQPILYSSDPWYGPYNRCVACLYVLYPDYESNDMCRHAPVPCQLIIVIGSFFLKISENSLHAAFFNPIVICRSFSCKRHRKRRIPSSFKSASLSRFNIVHCVYIYNTKTRGPGSSVVFYFRLFFCRGKKKSKTQTNVAHTS